MINPGKSPAPDTESQDTPLKRRSNTPLGSFVPPPCQATVTEPLKPVLDTVVTSGATHLYVSQTDKGEILIGGKCDSKRGWFIEPTVVLTTNPAFKLLREEIFGPVMTIYVYPDRQLDKTLELCDKGSPYALTGAIFGTDRSALVHMADRLRHAAGNFYINDKPTGAVVGQQPFGGSRASGTNDKAGSALNLQRWVTPRTIKETFVPPKHFSYPFLSSEGDDE